MALPSDPLVAGLGLLALWYLGLPAYSTQIALKSSRLKSCCPKPESCRPKPTAISPDTPSDAAPNPILLKKILMFK